MLVNGFAFLQSSPPSVRAEFDASGPISGAYTLAFFRALTDIDRDGYSSMFGDGDCAAFDETVHPVQPPRKIAQQTAPKDMTSKCKLVRPDLARLFQKDKGVKCVKSSIVIMGLTPNPLLIRAASSLRESSFRQSQVPTMVHIGGIGLVCWNIRLQNEQGSAMVGGWIRLEIAAYAYAHS